MPNKLISYLKLYHQISAAEEQYIVEAFNPKMFKEGEALSQPGSISKELFLLLMAYSGSLSEMKRGMK